MRRWSAVLTTTALMALTAIDGPAHASVSGPNDVIAFARQIGIGGADVFITNPDGTDVRQVPLGYPAEDFGIPIWSPDRSELLISHLLRFDAAGDILPFRPATVEPDGANFTVLEPPDGPFDMGCFAWHPDGARLLCNFGDDQPGIFSIRASDGGDPVRLTTDPYGAADVPTDVSPDGRRFVFLRYKPGASPGPRPFRTEQVALFVANLDGTSQQQITTYGLAEPHEIASAQWSPDGRVIISATTQGRLFIIRPDGTSLAPIRLQTGTDRYFAFEPDWSPDGTRVVFCMSVNGQEDIHTARADGSHLVQVTDTPDFENGPDWGPNTG
jgi:Tol biopolymer transport system component